LEASCLHAQEWQDLGGRTVRAGEETALPVVETILHVGIEIGGDVQEQLAVRGEDL